MTDRALPEESGFDLQIDAGIFSEARRLFEGERFEASLRAVRQALAHVTPPSPATGSGPSVRDGVVLQAWALHQLRRYDECRQWLRTARAQNLLPPDDPEALLVELWIAWSEGHHLEVVRLAGEQIASYQDGLSPLLGEFLFIRGNARAHLGEYPEALADCDAAYQFFRVLGRRRQEAEVCNVIGTVNLQSARFGEALDWLRRSLALNEELGLTRRAAANRLNMGIAHYKRGDYGRARASIERALAAQAQADESRNFVCRARIALGNVCRLERDFDAARSNLMTAYTLATGQRLPREECLALEFLGDVFRDEARPQEARRYYTRAMTIAQRLAPDGDLAVELGRREGECLLMSGQPQAALPVLEEVRQQAAHLGDRFEEGVVLRCLGMATAQMGDWPAARDHLLSSLELLAGSEARHEEGLTRLELAELWGRRTAGPPGSAAGRRRAPAPAGEPGVALEEALAHALAARHIFRDLSLPDLLARAEALVAGLMARRLDRPAPSAWRPRRAASGSAATPAESGEAGGRAGTGSVGAEASSPPQPQTVMEGRNGGQPIIVASPRLKSLLERAERFAAFSEPVLVTGETGTGKELIARHIHALSPRRDGPFLAINCAAVPGTLFEREFFGHHRGAFTSADADSPGYVATAEGGTLFLDEIGELPLESQPKLLRLLQDGTYTRLGDPRERTSRVRLIAATNADLDRLVAEGRFREDLHYRLRVLELALPPLRERSEDILPLLDHFLSEFAGRPLHARRVFDERSLRLLHRHGWPGNVREAIMVARRAVIELSAGGQLRLALGKGADAIVLTGGAGPAGEVEEAERLLAVLRETGGNKAEAARLLGVSRQTLYRWLKRLDIS
jgi:transcriptional regulator with AAA-type ATPase domain/tetratricopeptide (TPR) repeat protein